MVMLNAGAPEAPKTEDDFGGRQRPSPGRYHAVVAAAEEKGSKKKGTPGLELEFEVICDGIGPDNKPAIGQQGKKIPLFLSYISEKGDQATQTCIDRVTRLALCCGVLQPGEAKEVDWNDAIGRELIIEIEPGEEYEDKGVMKPGGTQVSFSGFWSLGNKAVADVPKDSTSPGMRALAKAGGPVKHSPAAGGAGNGNGNGNSGAAAQQPATVARKPSWKDAL